MLPNELNIQEMALIFILFYFPLYIMSLVYKDVDASIRLAVREKLGLKKVKKRAEGPRIKRMAEIALVYWTLFRVVDWNDGELRAKTD